MHKAKILAVIPARYASTRLPAKALQDIGGKAMVAHVYERVCSCSEISQVVVATDNQLIFNYLHDRNIPVLMTATSHQNGTERCAEVLEQLGESFDYLINVQGDEPFIKAEQIDGLAKVLDGTVEIATLIKKIESLETLFNPNTPKVIFNNNYEALYFSRQTIPYLRDVEQANWLNTNTFYKHIGIYAYRGDVLKNIVQLATGRLEKAESLEQLRWLEAGIKIKVVETTYDSMGVDTPEDLERARQFYTKNF